MPRAASPPGVQVSYRPQYRRCGNAGCARCAADGPGHGPYWYAFWWEDGRSRSRYLGRQAPAADVAAPTKERGMGASEPAPAPLSPVGLRVRTLGGFAVWRGETAIGLEHWASHRAAALFKCLLGAPGHRLLREQAVELLWPESEPAAGAANLRTTIHRLRQVLDGPDDAVSHLRADGEALVLAPAGAATPADDWLDATAFGRAAEAALAGQDDAACRAALACYGGDYLPDDPYEAWAAPLRETLRRRHLDLLLHLASLSATCGDPEEAEDCLRRVLAADPGHEEAAATLMGLLAAAGRRHEALRVYQALATALEEDLDVSPGAEIVALRAQLLAQETAPVAAHSPPTHHLPSRPTNLPIPLTSFVGRRWEVMAVEEALAESRLVTLTGPGGCGKTRLALEAAATLVEWYPDGVWLVELAALVGTAVVDAPLVPRAVIAALGLVAQPGRPLLDTLRDFLQPRHLLLVLDNCEHLIAACAELVAGLLTSCPHLRILATSREGLEVAGERTFLVPPLAAPDPDHLPDPAHLPSYEAVQLFLERARARRPALTLTATNAGAVAQICARLDGLPLAIELAAARVGSMTVEQISARLDDRFRLLTGGPRTALPRQQTLRGALDWSYTLLSGPERALLRRLSVFAGGCTLEAAAAVCAGGAVVEDAVLDLLGGLVQKSLVLHQEARYRLLETVRQYGQEQLEVAGEEATVRDRHLDWCLALGEQAAPHFRGAEQVAWLDRLEREHDNLRAALRWSMEDGGNTEIGTALTATIWPLWALRGYLLQGQRWLDAALSAHTQSSIPLRIRLLYGAQSLALHRGDFARVETLGAEGAALARQAGDAVATAEFQTNLAWGVSDIMRARMLADESLALTRAAEAPDAMAGALLFLGNLHIGACDLARAQAVLEECAALCRGRGDRIGLARALTDLGQVAFGRGHYARADALFEECLALQRALGHLPGIAVTLDYMGYVAYCRGDAARAQTVLEESVALCRRLGSQDHLAVALGDCAWLAWHEGNGQQAMDLLEEALAIVRETGDTLIMAALISKLACVMQSRGEPARAAALQRQVLTILQQAHVVFGAAEGLEGLASALAAEGQWARAARLAGAAGAYREAAGMPLPPPDRPALDRALALARGGPGADAFAAAWAAGRAMSLEEAIAEALSQPVGALT